ncbi:mitochondrial import receptor subunit TOM70-like [Drosophila pseudoobscura]|uniref:Mitochondrial import receptor subunit TOM70-like n=1 Tax=Drosophila pseudoobscura pseudoobscura TaxID=46245 RepID=A0A6I8UZW1_DROPS|nr:mitochondrial import receptor subunit TOM70 [Drosophila pseudoobscura]
MTDKAVLDEIQPIAELEAPGNNPEVSGEVATGVAEESISPLSAAEKFKKDGNRCFYNYRYVDAIRCYSKAIDVCPKEYTTELAIYYHNRAACHEMIENWIQAKEDCAKALEYNRRYAKAYFRRACAHVATMDLKECLADLTATCILEDCKNVQNMKFRHSVGQQLAIANAKEKMIREGTSLPSKRYIRSYLATFIADPMLTMTLPSSDDAVADAPVRGFARAHRAFLEERFEDVISACTEEIDSSAAGGQYRMHALFLRATLHLLSGSAQECEQDLQTLLGNDETDDELRIYAQIRYATLIFQANQDGQFLGALSQAEMLGPKNPDIYNQRAMLLSHMERFEEALDDFEIAARLAPTHALTVLNKHLTDYRIAVKEGDQERLEMSVQRLQLTTGRFPDCEEGLVMLSQVHTEQKNYLQASKCLERAVKLSPTNAELLCHQAVLEFEWHDDIELFFAKLEQAILLDSQCRLIYENLGRAELRLKNLPLAVNYFFWAISHSRGLEEMYNSYSLHNATVAEVTALENLGMAQEDLTIDILDIPLP